MTRSPSTRRAHDDLAWEIDWNHGGDTLVVAAVDGDGAAPGHVRGPHGAWLRMADIRAIEGWIDGTSSGVRALLHDGRAVALIDYDSGNIDPTATWNEYLYDGAWAIGAGRRVASWLGVPYEDWTTPRTS